MRSKARDKRRACHLQFKNPPLKPIAFIFAVLLPSARTAAVHWVQLACASGRMNADADIEGATNQIRSLFVICNDGIRVKFLAIIRLDSQVIYLRNLRALRQRPSSLCAQRKRDVSCCHRCVNHSGLNSVDVSVSAVQWTVWSGCRERPIEGFESTIAAEEGQYSVRNFNLFSVRITPLLK